MKRILATALALWAIAWAVPGFGQVKMTRDQILFYTSDWKGDRCRSR